jgi:oxygen-dependent protoporphyrinogen oxidase
LTRALLARRLGSRSPAGGGPAGPGGRLTSFLDGLQELTDHLELALGGSLRLASRVTRIDDLGARGLRVATEQGAPIDAACVVLASPAWVAAEILEGADAALARALAAIPSAPLAVVHLGFDEEDLGRRLDGFGFLVPRGQGPRILGSLWSSSIFAQRSPAGCALVTCMIGGAHDPEALELPDDRLLNLVRIDLRATMGLAANPRFVRVIRHPRGIPQYTLGHAQRLAAIEERLAAHPGLFVCGNSYRGISINACIEDAPRVAAAAVAALEKRG